MSSRGEEFAQLAHRILVTEGIYSLHDTARRLGWDYHVLHARVSNRVVFSADEICRLISVVPDPRLVSCLLRGTRFVAAERVEPDPVTQASREAIYRASHRMIIEAADVIEAIDDALQDGHIDHREAITVRREIESAERALASLGEHIRQITP
ncbi:phage regulatory CII family protein [Methylobacterium organophilum]|uniref:Uncharacterized protein n=1 Tax=Methylobacterium organophilum TaxID=410 RepID=A0ABQ4T6L6_METOR|nr:phage regulatory CII family protein [Methylobacterium organophilum]UMY18004.1 hypothetical protein MMB17_01185 [Methylobacterium organophilum]GJE25732.1 hypothetical protein LKMONMHP_0571 [Methylobacterium organophilum]